jgi:acetyltransferase-like isoleucine patch superfamily enzyme
VDPVPVVIVGCGKLGKLLWDYVDGDARWRVLAFLDDGHAGGMLFGLPVIASDAYDTRLTRNALMAIGYPGQRRPMVAKLAPLGLEWCSFVDRRAMVGRHAAIGRGSIVLGFTTISSGVRIGEFAYISANAHIGSGSVLGDYCSVLPSASIGETMIGNDCVIGMHSACLDHAVLEDGVSVAPFTLVRRTVPAGMLIAGNPPRTVRKR